jgi:hypothetical protein
MIFRVVPTYKLPDAIPFCRLNRVEQLNCDFEFVDACGQVFKRAYFDRGERYYTLSHPS